MESASLNREEVCKLLQKAVLNFCQKKYSAWSSNIEVDGIICISAADSCEQHVVKIHEKLGSDWNTNKSNLPCDLYQSNPVYKIRSDVNHKSSCDKSVDKDLKTQFESKVDYQENKISESNQPQEPDRISRKTNFTESVEGDYVIVKVEQSDEESNQESGVESEIGQRSNSGCEQEVDISSISDFQVTPQKDEDVQLPQNGFRKQNQEGRTRNRKLAVPTRRVKPAPQMYFSVNRQDNSMGVDTHYDTVEELDNSYQSFNETFGSSFRVSPSSAVFDYRKADIEPVPDNMDLSESSDYNLTNSQGLYSSGSSNGKNLHLRNDNSSVKKKKNQNSFVRKEQQSSSLELPQSYQSGSEFDMNTSPSLLSNPDHRYSCRYCGKGFTLKCTMVRHEKTICGGGGQAMYKCNLCDKSFTRSDSRCRHMLKTHGISSAEMDSWSKSFLTKNESL